MWVDRSVEILTLISWFASHRPGEYTKFILQQVAAIVILPEKKNTLCWSLLSSNPHSLRGIPIKRVLKRYFNS
jgi:hypothetical protein